jgi:hypothetical protein
MRTTLTLEDDAVKAVQEFARGNRLPLGKAASELIRRGSRFQLPIGRRNGFPYVIVPDDFPVITDEQVKRILEEE